MNYIEEQRLDKLRDEVDLIAKFAEDCIDHEVCNRGYYMAMRHPPLPREQKRAIARLKKEALMARYHLTKLVEATRNAQASGITNQW